MGFFRWAAIVIGGMLVLGGIRAIRKLDANVAENITGRRAVRLGCLWIAMGLLFLAFAAFDYPPLRMLFRSFLEAP